MFKKLFCMFVLVGALPMLAQTSSPSNNQQGQNGGGRRGNFSPCWQQAGIEKSAMEQRWATERDTRSQVEAVCANSSLTPQQKQQQAREIRQQARQKMEGLVTPEQEKALTACQQERGMNHGGGGWSAVSGTAVGRASGSLPALPTLPAMRPLAASAPTFLVCAALRTNECSAEQCTAKLVSAELSRDGRCRIFRA